MKRIRLWAIPAAVAVAVLVYVYGFAPETPEPGLQAPSVEEGRQDESILFHGHDTVFDSPVVIEKTDKGYTMDGTAMEERRHSNITHEGLSLAMQDRIGEPNMYYVLDVKRQTLTLYVNCEFGPCTYKRTIRAR